ncbi:bifunctional diguanylate cyclase/phosphodiesterase [Noviherbaspirillum denitrificans]|uniref:Diguanylate cyclase n=1 Tax=Noviherbaspirillum denitrificans TaxID=1968433 RepID=A0A254TGF6_9BURK|nr:bifunctional diguanylate cyclase/phosphodiesterase [Noviherbaspirillum denitrificans]OWW21247.1 hypothetical protein AYR66_19000 [Noviherbaspirillum denitrificans]
MKTEQTLIGNGFREAQATGPLERHPIVESLRDAVMAIDTDGHIVYWNAGACRMFLYDASEAIGCAFTQLLSGEFAGQFHAACKHASDSGHWEGELVGYRKDGVRITMLSRWHTDRDVDGKAARFVLSNTDIRLWNRFLADAVRNWQHNFDVLFAHHPDGVAAFDRRGVIASANSALAELTGHRREDLAGLAFDALVGDVDAEIVLDAFRKSLNGAPQTFEFCCRRKDGSTLDASVALVPNMLAHLVVGVNGFIKDVSERKRNESRILYLANHDALTGLPNRNLLHDRLQHAIEQARRLGNGMAVLFMDLNRFKVINDSLGHDKGDLLLCAVAKRLRSAVRDVDTVARLGGDEFVVVLENIQGTAHVQHVATVLLGIVSEPLNLDGHNLSVTTSIGASLYPDDGSDPFALLKHADLAMYAAKDAGQGMFRFYEPGMNEHALARLNQENSLRLAIERDELVLHYQPRLDLWRQTIVGVEALVRWDHPHKGMVYPGNFIELAEETGMIEALGEWVLHAACKQMQSWQEHGLAPIKVSVNISPLQLQSGRITHIVSQALEKTGIAPECLELEITESSLMQNLEASMRTLMEFQEMGISLSIDDFGTGYSSLSQLKRLPIDTLKIDKSFVRDLTEDADDATIVSATIAMAHQLHLRVVAEGVVSFEQIRFLQRCQCDEIQGFLLCQPLTAQEVESFLRTSRLRGIECRWMQ